MVVLAYGACLEVCVGGGVDAAKASSPAGKGTASPKNRNDRGTNNADSSAAAKGACRALTVAQGIV